MTATISSKGQLVLPKGIREILHVGPGDKVDFVVSRTGDVTVRPSTVDIRSLRGCLYKPGRKPVTVEEMNRAIREHAARSV